MKRILMIIVIGSLAATSAFSKSLIILDSKAKMYNSVWKKQFNSVYGLSLEEDQITEKAIKSIHLVFDGTNGGLRLVLNKKQRAQVQGFIKKFDKWVKKADEKGITLQKKIGEVTSKAPIFSRFKKYYVSADDLNMSFWFFSLKKGSHQLVLKFSEVTDHKNQFTKYTQGEIYLDGKEASKLEKHLSESLILKIAKKEIKKERDIASEFN